MLNALRRFTDPLKRRIFNMVARGIARAVDDSGGVQEWQAEFLRGELKGGIERFQEYGFTSKPLAGAEGIGIFVGGNRDHGLIIACEDRRYRLKGLADGEVALYTDEGDKIHFKRGGEIHVEAGTLLKITAPLTTISGVLAVTGAITGGAAITATAEVSGNGKNLSTHTHGGGVPPD